MDDIALRLWHDDDLWLLHSANTPEMTAHLNGPESDAEIRDRHARYLRFLATGEARMFVIMHAGHAAGSIGYWSVTWRGSPAFETGWFVLPEAQGQGLARRALALLLDDARVHAGAGHQLVAFPQTENPASNAVCRRSGFQLVGTVIETFRGAELTVNEWVIDIDEPSPS